MYEHLLATLPFEPEVVDCVDGTLTFTIADSCTNVVKSLPTAVEGVKRLAKRKCWEIGVEKGQSKLFGPGARGTRTPCLTHQTAFSFLSSFFKFFCLDVIEKRYMTILRLL